MTDDRQQHIDTLARALWDEGRVGWHEAMCAAYIVANADRARVLAALADAGWLYHYSPLPGTHQLVTKVEIEDKT